MSGDDSQEKSQEATQKKKDDAKKKGTVPRSKELTTFVILLLSASILLFAGSYAIKELSNIMTTSFTFDRDVVFDTHAMSAYLIKIFLKGMWLLLPLVLALFIATIASGFLLGGMNVSFSSLAPKMERIDPIKGFKRIFSVKGLMELVKALLKFTIIVAFALTFIYLRKDSLWSLPNKDFVIAIHESLAILAWGFLIISTSTFFVALIDVPFQILTHNKQLKMSMQEVKDEMKNSEGSPEVKGRIRRVQQEMSRKRMMQEIPNADVVITNPSHYAVALKYDRENGGAPKVIAKGCDFIAEQIKKVAYGCELKVLELPPLARAIYHTTKLNQEIPGDLYVAVAQVLAYVYQLDRHQRGLCKQPDKITDIPLPDNMQY